MPLNGSAIKAEDSASSSSSQAITQILKQSVDPGSYAKHIVPYEGRLVSCNSSSEQQISGSDDVPKSFTMPSLHREGHFSEIPSSSREGKTSQVRVEECCLHGKASSSLEDDGHGGACSLQNKGCSSTEDAVHGGTLCLKETPCSSTEHYAHNGARSLAEHISTEDGVNRGPCSLAEHIVADDAINDEVCSLQENSSSTEHVGHGGVLISQEKTGISTKHAANVGTSNLADDVLDHGQFRLHEEDEADIEKGLRAGPDYNEFREFELGQGSGAHDFYEGFESEEEGHCRVCHLVFDVELGTTETIRLGCLCKEDLAIAHRNCAEAWFKIKGNRVCEICGATAQNIVGNEETNFLEQWNDAEVSNTKSLLAKKETEPEQEINVTLVHYNTPSRYEKDSSPTEVVDKNLQR